MNIGLTSFADSVIGPKTASCPPDQADTCLDRSRAARSPGRGQRSRPTPRVSPCLKNRPEFADVAIESPAAFAAPVSANPMLPARRGTTRTARVPAPVDTPAHGTGSGKNFSSGIHAASGAATQPTPWTTSLRTGAIPNSFGIEATGKPCARTVIPAPSNVKSGAQSKGLEP